MKNWIINYSHWFHYLFPSHFFALCFAMQFLAFLYFLKRRGNKTISVKVADVLNEAKESYLNEQKKREDKIHLQFQNKFQKQVGKELAMVFDVFPDSGNIYRLEANGLKIWTNNNWKSKGIYFYSSISNNNENETTDIRKIILTVERLNAEKENKA